MMPLEAELSALEPQWSPSLERDLSGEDPRLADARAEVRDDPRERKAAPESDSRKDNQQQDQKPQQARQDRPKWPLAVAVLVVLIFIGVVLWILFRPRPDVWTDDAYVMVHYASIAPRVFGQVATVPVDDNQIVKAGQVLATLDPRDYERAVASAEAILGRDTAQLAEVTASLARQPALIAQQEAELAAARARLAIAEPDARRFSNLAAAGAGTVQQHQQADSTLRQSNAQVDSAQASLDAARRQLEVIKAQRLAAQATVEADRAQLEQARLNLSYTQILAPVDGMVTERSVQVGNIVSPGAGLMAVIPLNQVYITANYREVDLTHVRSGQAATIHVDAYDMDLRGTVENIPPASGASFAPIQPNNATGNFTKIVQRLPVKIVLDPNQPLAQLLRVGFSVETTIHTHLEDVVDEQRRAAPPVTEH
jgi:membrane fusion protein, multidrug efflux system